MPWTSIVIFLVIAVPLLGFLGWLLTRERFVRIPPGYMGLLISRGRPTDKVLPSGTHLVWRFGLEVEQYPSTELTYLTMREESIPAAQGSDVTYADPPLRVQAGERVLATVDYTIRFKVIPEQLQGVRARYGAEGIKGIVRDESRRVLIERMTDEQVGVADAFGARRRALEEDLSTRVSECLRGHGFEVSLFNLRELTFGSVDGAIEARTRAVEELELEKVAAEVRLERARHDAAANSVIGVGLTDTIVRYRQMEVLRALVERWDGTSPILSDHALLAAMALAARPQPGATPPENQSA